MRNHSRIARKEAQADRRSLLQGVDWFSVVALVVVILLICAIGLMYS
jgi:hypothetical protein